MTSRTGCLYTRAPCPHSPHPRPSTLRGGITLLQKTIAWMQTSSESSASMDHDSAAVRLCSKARRDAEQQQDSPQAQAPQDGRGSKDPEVALSSSDSEASSPLTDLDLVISSTEDESTPPPTTSSGINAANPTTTAAGIKRRQRKSPSLVTWKRP